jgi:hypothetical protein
MEQGKRFQDITEAGDIVNPENLTAIKKVLGIK